jgi:hypothetical protein
MYGLNEGSLDLQTGALSGFDAFVPAVAQVETATAAGTISASGNAAVVVTSALLPDPVTYNVAVLTGDTASAWAAKVRAALAADATLAALYTVGGSGASIRLTRRIDDLGDENDTTLNIALDNGTCTGITPAATSVNTTTGAQATGTICDAEEGVDAEGMTLPSMVAVSAVLIHGIRGTTEFEDYNTFFQGSVEALDLYYYSTSGSTLNTSLDFTNSLNGVAETQITIVAFKS